uniref:G-protein coupled receptors family 1 profile domain-containing protein n=1 Tax=Aquila chrysaetos chrysaetos TaxID=223781 RepID=A0A663E3X6_AQUCH
MLYRFWYDTLSTMKTNISHVKVTVKSANKCVIDFIFITSVRLLITKIVSKCFQRKKEVWYFLLCRHLLCCSLFCDLGAVCYTVQVVDVRTSKFVIWIIFGVQGTSCRRAFTLMSLNQCLAAYAVIICAWIVTKLKAICLLLCCGLTPANILKTEPPWPTVLAATFARTAGIVLIVVLTIVISYCLFYREGKHAGHLNSLNKKARKTIIIHGLQMSRHLLLLLITAVGRHPDNTILHLSAFLVLLFALCFNPVVYSQRNKVL